MGRFREVSQNVGNYRYEVVERDIVDRAAGLCRHRHTQDGRVRILAQ